MAENGYGTAPAGHIGRIPIYGKTHVNPMGNVEPPACIQNAMMTKDKKPFTYTPGGLDLSQIKTPSMVRRLARQRSLEEQEQAQAQAQAQMNNGGGYRPQGGPAPPPPPPMNMPAPPPPPPPIVIQVPTSKSPKPVAQGERPEIVIPENPIGMLRKTNSPYHWENEDAKMQRMGPIPKFQEKVPSPLTVKMPQHQPSTFSQQQPQTYTPQGQNNFRHPESPIHRPEAQYMQKSASPFTNGSPPTRELLQRQDSQFNKSPQPFNGQSPISNNSPYSPTPNNNWRQPEKTNSPIITSPQSPPQVNRGPFSPNTPQYSPQIRNPSPPRNSGPAFHTLPRAGQRNQENTQNNVIYNNTNQTSQSPPDVAPWRTSTLNRNSYQREPEQSNVNNNQQFVPPWKTNENTNNNEQPYIPAWQTKQENQPQQQYQPPWVNQDTNNNKVQESSNTPWRSQNDRTPATPQTQQQEQPRYQSSMSIPVTTRKQDNQNAYTPPAAPQKEAVYVNQEPIYFCPDSPKSIPPWVKTQKEKTKTPPPEWVQRPLENRRSAPRELVTPPKETEPEWVRKSNEIQRAAREVVSPPKYQQSAQPSWSTRPSENRKSLPRDNDPNSSSSRVIPIQMEVSDASRQGHNQPQLRITIGMNNPQDSARTPFSPPTQRIMRVLSPQLVRMDEPQHDLPALNRSFQQDNQPKTRIIPIQIEGGNGGANKSFGGRY